MVLEGAMVAIACIALTLPPPGMVFGLNWKIVKARAAASGIEGEKPPGTSTSGISMERLREDPK